jgi:WD40 repeat protein
MDKENKENKNKNKKNKIELSTVLYIYTGTYEGKLYVIALLPKEKEKIEQFSITSSKNAIRTIYHNENDLFVSGTDEIIHMYNIHNKESNGDLVTYSGSINDIKIVKNWLIAAGDENNIPLWRMSDFSNVINLKGHKSSINSFDVHNKGGFLVSCGRDKKIILFNLMNGLKLGKFEMDFICNKVQLFHLSKFVLAVFDLHIYIIEITKNTTKKEECFVQKCDFKKRINNAFVIKNKLIIFFNDGEVKLYNIEIKDKKYIPFKDDSYVYINLEVPEKENENDLDIKIKFVSIARNEKLKMFTIVFSNDDIYLFDLNKLMRLTKNENGKLYKKYYQLTFLKQGKITALDTEFKDEEIEEEEINI